MPIAGSVAKPVRGPRRIGILGGMGPEATILLQQKLLAAVAAREDADHIPLIIDMNPQVPSRIGFLLEGRGADPAPVLAAMARGLQDAGAKALAMPCNTAHHFAPAIRAAVDIPFLNMVELSADHAARALAPGASVGLLASPALHRTGVMDAALSARGLRAIWPGPDHDLLEAIRAIKAQGPNAQSRAALAAAARDLARRGATLQLIACTELSLIADAVPAGVACADTLDILVDAIRDLALAPPLPEHAR